jgi:hypothetical protein
MRLFLAAIIATAAAGCAGEARPQTTLQETASKLQTEASLLPASQHKARIEELASQLETQLAETADRETSLERLAAFAAAAGAAKIELGFATDGKDWSGDGWDDGVEAHIIPRDDTGSAVKTPGAAEVELAEEGGLLSARKTIDSWVISTDTLRRSWNESLFPAYVAQLPWHAAAPAPGTYTLTVKFTPLYGQELTATKSIEVTTAQ